MDFGAEVILKWVNVTCQIRYKHRNWERQLNIPLNGKPRAMSILKSQLAWQPVDSVNSVTTSPVQLHACEQRSCLSLLPLDCQEKVQLVGWVKQLFLKKVGKHIAWLTHHNLKGKMNPPTSTWGEERKKAERKEREDREARKPTLGLIETRGRRTITWCVRAHPHSWPGCLSKLSK